MKQQLTTVDEPRVEVDLPADVAAHLVAQLGTYYELVDQRKILEFQIDALRNTIGIDVFTSGYEALQIAGSKVTLVRGVTNTLDKLKLYAQGVTQAQVERATVTKPKKPYWKITAAGEEEAA